MSLPTLGELRQLVMIPSMMSPPVQQQAWPTTQAGGLL